jgi:aminobenzoyl-glutamate utilization protein B
MPGSRPGIGAPPRARQVVARGRSPAAQGAMVQQSLGGNGLTLFVSRDLLQRAQAERREKTDGEFYVCRIPQDVRPRRLDLA